MMLCIHDNYDKFLLCVYDKLTFLLEEINGD